MVTIEFDSVSFGYHPRQEEPFFSGFSLEIPAGERLAIVGPSGAGKTTLLKLAKGLLSPWAGEVRINGVPLRAGELNRSAAAVFANPENQMVSPLVAEDVAFALENEGLPAEEIAQRVAEALQRVGLWERAGEFSHCLSGGEQQRLVLAGALAMRKGCLLLDDPLGMLDCLARAEMLELLKTVHQRERFTLVHATQDLQETFWAERLLALDRGRLRFDGPPHCFLRERRLIQELALELPAIAIVGERLAAAGLTGGQRPATIKQLLALLSGD